jgi:Cu/Ag efflux protein CusF
MSMGFELEDPAQGHGLAAGDKVRFDFRAQGDRYIILDVEKSR